VPFTPTARVLRPRSSFLSAELQLTLENLLLRIKVLDTSHAPELRRERERLWGEFYRLLQPLARRRARLMKARASCVRSCSLTVDEISSYLLEKMWKAARTFDPARGDLGKCLGFACKRVWGYVRTQGQDVKGPSPKSKDARAGTPARLSVISRDAPRPSQDESVACDGLTAVELRLLERGANEEWMDLKLDCERLLEKLTTLTDSDRQLIQDLDLDEKSLRELASSGSARAALRKRHDRVLVKLRKLMGE